MDINITIDVNSLISDDEWEQTMGEVVRDEIKDATKRAVRQMSKDLIRTSPELQATILNFEKRLIDREIERVLGE